MPQESEQSIVQTVRAREVVGTVHNLELLESMVVALSAAGFDKSDIDLMASREAVLEKLPAIYADPIYLAEIPELPRRELVTRDEGTTVTGLVFGTLISLAALGERKAVRIPLLVLFALAELYYLVMFALRCNVW